MKSKKNQDILLAVICIVFGAAIFLLIPDQIRIVNTGSRGSVTAQTFPYLAAVLFIVSSVGLLLSTLLKNPPQPTEDDSTTVELTTEEAAAKKENLIRTALVFALMIAYTVAMNFTGFILSSIIFGVIFLYINCIRKWWQYLIFVILVFPLFALFKYALCVPLPTLFL